MTHMLSSYCVRSSRVSVSRLAAHEFHQMRLISSLQTAAALFAATRTSSLRCTCIGTPIHAPLSRYTSSFISFHDRLRRTTNKSLTRRDASTDETTTDATDPPSSSSFATDYHAPVMCTECVDNLLQCRRSRNNESPLIFVDGTCGGGGHSQAILQRLKPGDVLFGCDVDPTALETVSQRLSEYMQESCINTKPLFIPVESNFCDLHNKIPSILHPATQEPIVTNGVDGILLDLGVSSYQIDTPERGFAFVQDGPLDMRMGTTGLSAADVCNQFDEAELRQILKSYGDEPRAKRIAQSIVNHRPLTTTNDLVQAVADVTPARAKSRRMGRTATLARVFQSLRIVVNQEDIVLEQALTKTCPALVRPGGRMVILSYHSMEDRYAKRIIRDGSVEWKGTPQQEEKDMYGNYIGTPKPWKRVGKPQKATDEEVELNPRARSATLRVGERQDTLV